MCTLSSISVSLIPMVSFERLPPSRSCLTLDWTLGAPINEDLCPFAMEVLALRARGITGRDRDCLDNLAWPANGIPVKARLLAGCCALPKWNFWEAVSSEGDVTPELKLVMTISKTESPPFSWITGLFSMFFVLTAKLSKQFIHKRIERWWTGSVLESIKGILSELDSRS